jgi:uncharacterized membrane protein
MMNDIEVEVPVRTAYNQWTQFTDFPLFMSHVAEVEQLDDTHVRFTATILGIKRQWEAEITEQTPDQRIAWVAVDGAQNAGVVTFHPLSDNRTRIVLQLDMDPDGFLETIADKGGFVADRSRQDLASFKEFIEMRGQETGEFRETVARDPERDARQASERYSGMLKDELLDHAAERGVEGRADMTKAELVEALVADDTDPTR